ncbi:hypothetical protein SAMN05192559_104131 [Halobacillus karajensis]|nr:hypothetical protein SAMN05192559_104131 [Halobacillus karajensis]
MQKVAKYISISLFVIAGLLFLVGLFIDIAFSWLYTMLFLVPSLIIHELLQMPAKGKKKDILICLHQCCFSNVWARSVRINHWLRVILETKSSCNGGNN